jgi:hypothetical protein
MHFYILIFMLGSVVYAVDPFTAAGDLSAAGWKAVRCPVPQPSGVYADPGAGHIVVWNRDSFSFSRDGGGGWTPMMMPAIADRPGDRGRGAPIVQAVMHAGTAVLRTGDGAVVNAQGQALDHGMGPVNHMATDQRNLLYLSSLRGTVALRGGQVVGSAPGSIRLVFDGGALLTLDNGALVWFDGTAIAPAEITGGNPTAGTLPVTGPAVASAYDGAQQRFDRRGTTLVAGTILGVEVQTQLSTGFRDGWFGLQVRERDGTVAVATFNTRLNNVQPSEANREAPAFTAAANLGPEPGGTRYRLVVVGPGGTYLYRSR